MEDRKKSLLVLYLVNFVGSSGYAILLPLFPPLAIQKDIDPSFVGYILCLYPVGNFAVSLVLGQSMSNANMKKIMLFGIFLTIIGMMAFALLPYVDNKIIFIVMACSARLITGIGASCCFTPVFSLAAYLYYDNVAYILAQMEMVAGVALFSGPLFAGLFQTIGENTPLGGYQLPFYVFILLYIITIPCLMFGLKVKRQEEIIPIIQDVKEEEYLTQSQIIPNENNTTPNNNQDNQDNQRQTFNRLSQQRKSKFSKHSVLTAIVYKLGYFQIFKIKGVVVTYISFAVFFLAALAMRSYLAIQLQEVYQLSSLASTAAFLIITITYFIGAFWAGSYKTMDRKVTFAAMLFIVSVQYFFNGPDVFFTRTPHDVWFVMVSQAIYGFTSGTMFNIFLYHNRCSIIMVEYIDIIKQQYPNNDDDITDIASALYVSALSIGEFLGPIVGAQLIPEYGFDRSGSIMGFIMLGVAFFYTAYLIQYKANRSRVNDSLKLIA